ncbi:hypothetical protein DBR11_23815 [Pedobacter sp. HMWF019]|uniref:hypothetical protein n=1 Tax=Pedobacter sp. HMWF019 TaxID=2056856 RepID=UPI000D3B99B6|nr:hypothetical protein [Pedobacter sp. HMWF019]PTS94262.1 hypothetical protein DBR11_23815 [Pedobacter sp. HMWF019]
MIVLQNIGNDISPNALMEPVSQILDNEQNYDLPELPALKKSIVVTSAQLKPCVETYQVNGDSSRKMVISSRQNRSYAKY